MHKLEESFRARLPPDSKHPHVSVKFVGAECTCAKSMHNLSLQREQGEAPCSTPQEPFRISSSLGKTKTTKPSNSAGMFVAEKAGSGKIENVDSRNKKNCSVWSLFLVRPSLCTRCLHESNQLVSPLLPLTHKGQETSIKDPCLAGCRNSCL